MKTWNNLQESPKGVRYPKSAWGRFEPFAPFRWATPAFDPHTKAFPEPWRVADPQDALDLLKKLFPEHRDLYTQFGHDQIRGRNTIWVGLRDNRNREEHRAKLESIFEWLQRQRLPAQLEDRHILLVDDVPKDYLTKRATVAKLAAYWSDAKGQENMMRQTNPDSKMRKGLSWVKRGKTASSFDLELPDVNMNGTGVDDLINQARGVVSAIGELQEALAKATPHGRDYFDQSRAMGARRSVEAMAKTLSVWDREWRGVAMHLMDAKYKRQR